MFYTEFIFPLEFGVMVFCYQNCSDLLWEKNCSSDQEKLLEFEAEGRDLAKFLRSLDQFIPTVNGQYNFQNRILFWLVPGTFSDLTYWTQYNWNWKKIIWILKSAGKVRKCIFFPWKQCVKILKNIASWVLLMIWAETPRYSFTLSSAGITRKKYFAEWSTTKLIFFLNFGFIKTFWAFFVCNTSSVLLLSALAYQAEVGFLSMARYFGKDVS